MMDDLMVEMKAVVMVVMKVFLMALIKAEM